MNTIRKALLLCSISSMASITMSAQYMVSNKYDVWLEDTGEEIYTRKNVDCTEDGQELWNSCWVRIRNRRVYLKD